MHIPTNFRRAALGAAFAVLAVSAGEPARPVEPKPIDQARAAIAKRFPTLRIEGLRPAAVDGLWEFSIGLDVYYMSTDGKLLVRGDVIDLDGDRNVTESRRAELRVAQLDKASEADMIVFSPEKPTHTVTVFTDIDCGYCRRLHSQIDQYLKLGIRVRYLAFPRGGPGSESWRKAVDVWCAPDRNLAMTRAKRDQPIARGICDGGAVTRGYQLGELFRLEGTPLIITDTGQSIGGYLAPAELKQRLDGPARKPRG